MKIRSQNEYVKRNHTADQQKQGLENMLSIEARLNKNLQAQLLMKVSSPKFIVKAGDGLPLMLLILFKCLYKEQTECELTLIQVAASLKVSPATVTNWRKKLECGGLVSSKRNRGSITFYLDDELSQYMKISETCLDGKQFKEQQANKLSSELISSLLIRVDRLEEKVYQLKFGGGL